MTQLSTVLKSTDVVSPEPTFKVKAWFSKVFKQMPTFKDGSSLADSNRTLHFTGNIHVLEVMHSLKCLTEQRPFVPWETAYQDHIEEHSVTAAAVRPPKHSHLQNTVPQPQAAGEVNAVASSLLGRSTSPSQAPGIPPAFSCQQP